VYVYIYIYIDPPIFQTKKKIWGENGMIQNKTRIKTPRGTPKNTIQCKIPFTEILNFEWRAAAAGLKPIVAARPRLAFASRRYARALAECVPRQDHVYITTDESFRFHKNEFDHPPCQLDSTENPKYPTPP